MNLLPRFVTSRLFGYDAVDSRGRRKPPLSGTRPEDRELFPNKRRSLIATARDLPRNFTIAGWAVRKHLDYVSTFSFHARTGDPGLDAEIESLVRWYSLARNCDAAGRHSLASMVRLAESHRTIDGDILLVKLSDGRMQAIEGDRVATTPDLPDTVDRDRCVHGVVLNDFGQARQYVVCDRDGFNGNGLKFGRLVNAGFARLHGYFTRVDQVRGIAPLAPAINSFRDVYEGCDYALAKMKVSQLFALAFYREASDQLGSVTPETDGDGGESGGYGVDFGKGPVQLDLDPGDRAEFLESKTPSSEFQQFVQAVIGMALKSLDIPYSFYDESFTTYSGSRGAILQYESSADVKRADNRDLLDDWTAWRLRLAVQDGDLTLPRGKTVSDLRWEWISRGIRWIDPLKEVTADTMAVKAGFTSPQQVCKENNVDFYDMVDQRAEAEAYAKQKGVTLEYMLPAGPLPTDDPAAAGEDEKGGRGGKPADPRKQERQAEDEAGQRADAEIIRGQIDAYGVAVRAGVITPQTDDEDAFRQKLDLPPMSDGAKQAWLADKGVRRPITLVPPGGAKAAASSAPQTEETPDEQQ